MCPSPDDDEWIQVALSAVEAATSRFSPADKFDSPDRAAGLRAQRQRSQRLNEYYDEAVAAIRGSLEQTPNKGGRTRDERG